MVQKAKKVVACDLHCHSTFSLLDGMGQPKDVVARAKELGWTHASMTEHGWMGGVPAFYKACRDNGIKPIIGCELYVTPDHILGLQEPLYRKEQYHLTVLALSAEGYHNLVAWTTFANQRENYYHKPRISIPAMLEVAPYPVHHNVVLSGCLASELLRFMMSANGNLWTGAEAYVDAMRSVFPNFYLEFQNHKIEKYLGNGLTMYEELIEKEAQVHKLLWELHKRTGCPHVITNDSHMQRSQQRKSHIAMKVATWKHHEGAMDHMNEGQVNSQLANYSYWGNYMRDMEKVADGIPHGAQALENVREICQEANIVLEPLEGFNYSIPFSGYSDPIAKIKKRSAKALQRLVKKHGNVATERFEHELRSMGDFAHYLLCMSDFQRNARSQGILTHTRGSAANSILCFCLGIHSIDSIEYKLTFERFYNPSRKKLPDIDIDIDPERYDDYMRFVFEHMAEREKDGQVVKISNYGTMANRSAFRMIAESLGISKEVQDEVSKLLPTMIDSGMVEEEDQAYEFLEQEYPELYELTAGIFDNIKNISQHACGWLFGTRDRPIEKWVPLILIASSGRLVTQYNYKLSEMMGLVKGDFIPLKTLTIIRNILIQIGWDVDMSKIPLDDPETFKMIREGKTEGVHSLQGKTQRQGAIEARVNSVHDVVAVQALYRPSGTRTGFDKIYVKRKLGKEDTTYTNQIAEAVLGETFGLPIYQEQILDIGKEIGMNFEEIQQLLDAIKLAKGVGRGAAEAFEKIKPTFMRLARKHMSKSDADEIWQLFDAFQGYGFNKGHATSYAILAVKCAYLKRHFPREFFASVLDVYPSKLKYIAASRAEGFKFLSPDINAATAGFTSGVGEKEIMVGLARVAGLGPVAVKEIIDKQPYASFDDFKKKVIAQKVNTQRIERLSAIGSFESFGLKRPEQFIIRKKIAGRMREVKLTERSLIEFGILGFCLTKPPILKGIKVKRAGERKTERWHHLGLYKGLDLTEGPASVSKLFWIPPLPKSLIYEKKASAWAKVKTNLLTVIDENGVPLQIKANEDHAQRTAILEFLASKCRGSVISFDGAIRSPFLFDGPLTFQMFGVTGAYNDDPQFWIDSDKEGDYRLALSTLVKKK